MKPIRLYITSVCFLLLLLQGGGMLLYYTASQSIQQSIMESSLQNLTDEELCSLKLSVHQFESALLDNQELLLDQQKYDIKSTTIVGDTVVVVAYRDKVEENSIHRIAFLLNGKEDTQMPSSKLFHLFLSEFLPPSIEQSVFLGVSSIFIHQDYFQVACLQGYLHLNLPPPKGA